MLVEQQLQAIRRNRRHTPPGQISQPVQIQQMALRKQHHQGADRIIEQHGLHLVRRVEPRVLRDFAIGDGQVTEHAPDNRRRARNGRGAGNFSHGLHPFCTTQI